MDVTFEGIMLFAFETACGPRGRNQPLDNHECGMENSDHPQSMQTRMSGDGVRGGWLIVRGPLRYSRISAGIIDREPDWHLGQTI
jgi:hypothetical protein